MLLKAAAFLLSVLGLAACGQSQTYQTTLTKAETAERLPGSIDRIVMTFEYQNAVRGPDNFSILYFRGERKIFEDQVIIEGMTQDLSGAPRANVFFDFNESEKMLRQWNVGVFDRNLIQDKVYTSSDGDALDVDGYVFIDVFANGQQLDSVGSSPWIQSTKVIDD